MPAPAARSASAARSSMASGGSTCGCSPRTATPRHPRSRARGRSASPGPRFRRRISDVRLGRELVVGGGLSPEPLDVEIGGRIVAFAAAIGDRRDAAGPDPGVAERDAGGRGDACAGHPVARRAADLVVSDGPLTYFASGPAIGLIKRQSRAYLDAEHAQVLGRLQVGRAHPDLQVRRAATRALLVVPAPRAAPRRSTARWRASFASRC